MDNKNSSSAPLLTKKSDNAKEEETSLKADIWSEIKLIWFIAGPAILTSLFQYSLATVTQTMVGHIGTLELAAFGMQNLFIAGIGFGVMLGMGSALETLCGQAYGAGRLNMMAWSGFSWLAFAELPGFIGLSCASAVMLCLEYWCVMVLIIFAGLFDHPQITVDATSICMSVESWLFMIPLGFTAAISVRVSNELGRGNPKKARFSVWVMVMMAVVIQTIFAVMIFATKKDFPSIFTEDEWVMNKVTKIAPFLCVSIFLSSVQPVLSGVAIGAGWQAIVAYVNIGCYYLVGLATGAILGFKFHLGLEGLWGGVLLGIALQTIILIIITLRTDWEKEASVNRCSCISTLHLYNNFVPKIFVTFWYHWQKREWLLGEARMLNLLLIPMCSKTFKNKRFEVCSAILDLGGLM
ncbi:hypothetical protein IFM89_017837, partial [Coptis chinensis]